MKVHEVLGRFDNVQPAGEHQWSARCPCHDDNHNSLCIGQGDDGRTLLHCQAGCPATDVLLTVDLTMRDLMPEGCKNGKPSAEVIARYDYRDEQGKLLYQVERRADKSFCQRRPGEQPNTWVYKLGNTRRVLYRLPELIASEGVVFKVEGEKDVDRLGSLGRVATCNPGGAGKWQRRYNVPLKGRDVIIIPDNDDPGRQHAQKVADTLHGTAASVKILELPDLKDKGDVSDWLDNGGSVDGVIRLASECPEWEPPAETETPKPHEDHRQHVLLSRVPSNTVTNAVKTEGEGAAKAETFPLTIRQVIDIVNTRTEDWPRRVGGALFIHDPEHGIGWLQETPALFGWLANRVGRVVWTKGPSCVGRAELFAELQRTATNYRSVENLPHEPLIKDHYYACGSIKPGNGKALEELLNRFTPATDVDRRLMKSAVMTPVWGGPCGARPDYVVTSDDGRGTGKTKFATMVGHLWGGTLDFDTQEDINKIKSRLLSPEALTKRVCLLDNVKSLKFSWAALEGMVTAQEIGGHKYYVGEGTRPNTLTWFITLNGASLSKDMAQRSVIIKVRKPVRSATWEEQTVKFINDHRQAVIADCIAALRAERFPLAKFTRWASWEKDVLQRLPEPGEIQKVILERQASVDAEDDEAGLLEDFFANELERLTYDPDADQIFIPSVLAAQWYNRAHNDKAKTNAVSRMILQGITEGTIKRLKRNNTHEWGRGFIWIGSKASLEDAVLTDIEARSKYRQESSW